MAEWTTVRSVKELGGVEWTSPPPIPRTTTPVIFEPLNDLEVVVVKPDEDVELANKARVILVYKLPLSTARPAVDDGDYDLSTGKSHEEQSEMMTDDRLESHAAMMMKKNETQSRPPTFDRLREKHPSLSKWPDTTAFKIAGAGVLFSMLLCCGGFATFLAKLNDESAKKELQEANELWANEPKNRGRQGNTSKSWKSTGSIRQSSLNVLPSYNDSSNLKRSKETRVRRDGLIEKADKEQVAVVLNSSKAKEVMAQFQRETGGATAAEIAKKKSQEKERNLVAKKGINRANYDQIKDGMTRQEVEALLGPGKEISSAGNLQVVNWESGVINLRVITITFEDGRVTAKAILD